MMHTLGRSNFSSLPNCKMSNPLTPNSQNVAGGHSDVQVRLSPGERQRID